MLEVKLNFRDTEAGEYPEKSMEVLVASCKHERILFVSNVGYSNRHHLFNEIDSRAEPETGFNVRYWLPMEEFEAAFHAAEEGD